MRYAYRQSTKKKGQDKNPAPFLNPISYEKPNIYRQGACREGGRETPGSKNIFTLMVYRVLRDSIGCHAKCASPDRSSFSPRVGIFFPILELLER
jgi:hypothetical protein